MPYLKLSSIARIRSASVNIVSLLRVESPGDRPHPPLALSPYTGYLVHEIASANHSLLY